MPGPGRRKPAIWGRPIHQIEQLVAAHGIDAFVAAAGEVEARVDGVPRVIDHIAAHLATSAADDEPPAPAMMRPILERRRQGLAQLVATYEEQDLPVPDVHIADLQEVEAQLAKYDDQVSDHSAEGVTT